MTGIFVVGRRPKERKGWLSVRVKDVCPYVNRGIAPIYAETETDVIAVSQRCVLNAGQIDLSNGRAIEDDGESHSEARLRSGDILINSTGTGTLGRAGLVTSEVADHIPIPVADGHVTIVRLDEHYLLSPFMAYLLGTETFFRMSNECLAVGSTNQMELGRDALRTLGLLIPSLADQRRVVEFLDEETRRIDDLIDEQLHLTSLLGQYRASTLDRVIWGHDGESPPTVPLWRVTQETRPIMYGIVLPGPNVQEGVLLVKGGDVRPHRLVPELLNRTAAEIEAPFVRSRLLPGDILYAIRGSIGDAAMVPQSLDGANITQDLARISPAEDIHPQWLLYALQSPRFFSQMEREARGATIRGINIWTLRKGRIPNLPLEAQRAMAAHLGTLDKRLSTLVDKVRTQIELLREHRQALITAAVTGQLDLNGKAA